MVARIWSAKFKEYIENGCRSIGNSGTPWIKSNATDKISSTPLKRRPTRFISLYARPSAIANPKIAPKKAFPTKGNMNAHLLTHLNYELHAKTFIN